MEKERIHLHNCIIQGRNENMNISDIITTLHEMRSNNFMLKAVDINLVVAYLINYNILFYDGDNVLPQKALLLNVINEFLD